MDQISSVWSKQPETSIVVPAYNESKVLASTIRAMAKAVFVGGTKTELLVIDNASTDETAEIAERLGARIVHEKKKGLSYAREAGIQNAAGDIILSTDADTRVGPQWIRCHERHYADGNIVGVVGGHRFEGAHSLLVFYKACARAVQKLASLTSQGPKGHWSGCNTSYRTRTVRDVGGYDPGRDQAEDLIISMKLQRIGTVLFDPSPEISVVTDGRRFDTASKVMHETCRKLRMLSRGSLYSPPDKPQTFEDIR